MIPVNLPAPVWNRVLRAVVRDAHRALARGPRPPHVARSAAEESDLRHLAEASGAIGDAIAAPPNRRFVLPGR